jgi:nitrate reductase gamma subunit
MEGLLLFSQILVVVAAAVCVVGLVIRLRAVFQHPDQGDLARPRGSPGRGVLYAFTLGMAPWEKPATSLKFWLSYLRGILFHIGAFAGLAVLIISPWLDPLWSWLRILLLLGVGLGFLAGLAGLIMRATDPDISTMSIPDDYASLVLVELFLVGAFLALLNRSSLALFYLLSSLMLFYVPVSKIRHCIYFFLARFYYGSQFGRHGTLEHHPLE